MRGPRRTWTWLQSSPGNQLVIFRQPHGDQFFRLVDHVVIQRILPERAQRERALEQLDGELKVLISILCHGFLPLLLYSLAYALIPNA